MVNLYITPVVYKEIHKSIPIIKNEYPDLLIFTWTNREITTEEYLKDEGIKVLCPVVSKDKYSTYHANTELPNYLTEGIFILDLEKITDITLFFHIKEDFVDRSTFLFLFPSSNSTSESIIAALNNLKEILIQQDRFGNYIFVLKDALLVSKLMILTTIISLIEIHKYLESSGIKNQIILQWFKRVYIVDDEIDNWLKQTERLMSLITSIRTEYLDHKIRDLKSEYERLKQFIDKGSEYTKVVKSKDELMHTHLLDLLLDRKSIIEYFNINSSNTGSLYSSGVKTLLKSDLFVILVDKSLEVHLDTIRSVLNEKMYKYILKPIPSRGVYIYYTVLLSTTEITPKQIENLLAKYKPYLNKVKESRDLIFREYEPIVIGLPIMILNRKTFSRYVNERALYRFEYLLNKIYNCLVKLSTSTSQGFNESELVTILKHLSKHIENLYKYYTVLKIYALYKSKGKKVPGRLNKTVTKVINKIDLIHETIEKSEFEIKDILSLMEASKLIKTTDVVKIVNFIENFKSTYRDLLTYLRR